MQWEEKERKRGRRLRRMSTHDPVHLPELSADERRGNVNEPRDVNHVEHAATTKEVSLTRQKWEEENALSDQPLLSELLSFLRHSLQPPPQADRDRLGQDEEEEAFPGSAGAEEEKVKEVDGLREKEGERC
jgi:hypothetical protein